MPNAEQISLIVEAVRDAARRDIMPRFRRLGRTEVSRKTSRHDLVTVADTAAEARITAALARGWPEATVVGEEATSRAQGLRAAAGTADPAVLIDPVDGTWNFATGLATFGVIVAVTRRGRPTWGMLYDPVMDDWIEAAAGGPARRCGPAGKAAPVQVAEDVAGHGLNGFVTLGLYGREQRRALALAGIDLGRVNTLRCSCHEYRQVAQGHADFCLSGPLPNSWDHAAGSLIVRAAGGVSRFLDGSDYDAGRERGPLLTANSEITWARVAEHLSFLL